jgi:hypothetical protein
VGVEQAEKTVYVRNDPNPFTFLPLRGLIPHPAQCGLDLVTYFSWIRKTRQPVSLVIRSKRCCGLLPALSCRVASSVGSQMSWGHQVPGRSHRIECWASHPANLHGRHWFSSHGRPSDGWGLADILTALSQQTESQNLRDNQCLLF